MLTWIATILLLLVALLLRRLVKGKKGEPEPAALKHPPRGESIQLEHLSQVWTGEERERVIRLEDLSKNWRDPLPVKKSEPEHEKPVFSHPEIGVFFQTWVDDKPNMTGDVLLCVEELLKLLDREGDCPSVVNRNKNEVEAKLEEDVYTLLASLPLYRHSLNVAIELASRCSQKLLGPMALITGLAHDLGKRFKNADQVCRNHEITFLLKKQKTVTQVKEAASDWVTVAATGPISDLGDKPASPALLPRQSPPSGKSRERLEKQKAVEAQIAVFGGYPDQDSDIFGTAASKEGKIENTLVPIEWFDPGAALAYLKQFVNRTKGGRFFAFSMPDGIVYVQVSYFWQMAKRLSRSHPMLRQPLLSLHNHLIGHSLQQ